MKNPKTSTEKEPAFGNEMKVQITAHAPRRRAGLAFGPEPTIVDVDELSDEQKMALEGDPQLTIRPYIPERVAEDTANKTE